MTSSLLSTTITVQEVWAVNTVDNYGQYVPEMDRSDLLGVIQIVYLIVAQSPREVARSTGEVSRSADGLSFELRYAPFGHRSQRLLNDTLRTLDQRQQVRSRADQLQRSDNQTITGVISVDRIGLGGVGGRVRAARRVRMHQISP